MTDFLIKSTIALCVLLGAYYLFLEKEKFHQFNRFFLLASLVISFVIPFVTIEIIQQISAVANNSVVIPEQVTTNVVVEKTSIFIIIGWFLYGVVTTALLFRFVNNLYKMIKKAKTGTKIKHQNATLILLKEQTLPYTFLNFIFINENEYESNKIEPELFTHELIHVNQKHSLDVLLIEVIKTIFWFNPVFVFYKKAIQLNHEFLADEKVVKSYNNVSFYQNLLLSKANQNPIYYLASNLNYSVTKKRLIMMTTTTSPSRGLLKKSILLPLLTGLVYFLCTKTVAQEVQTKTAGSKEAVKKDSKIGSYYDKTTFKIKDEKGKVVTEKKYKDLTAAEQKAVPNLFEGVKFPATKEEIDAKLEKGGPETVEIDLYDPKNQKIKKTEGTIYKTNDLTEDPSYPGGIEQFYKFIGQNFKVPVTPADVKLKGRVYITFVIEKDGALSDFKMLRDIGYGTGDEALRVLKLCPNWIPGKVNGEPVATMYSLPITIQAP
ncbi:M56 family metallopeptidase [Flavobacterium hibernum]|uniref:Regulatory sensor-transducer, BlaR1/MecR1 family protein n=1 Tax=Flavobacterium hibernum TaxID=37752 RepID=A0A0D0EML9_9FLAO|nr:M56 family metallopeptidase [Flavobacterium hibernum]KIO53865.1 regulatory sensor-transducer, BlaR1/MecR1 family protein [Flavobacterium hibernum]OXA90523.1 regulatory sensor-transducer, BlaR1/MecR1 family protein [Flavobacterium hibernum]STO14799.1 Antirepressor regulating drug resistance, predicted signal transduction N-terminal membrane component [Flavobacterium hibernum]